MVLIFYLGTSLSGQKEPGIFSLDLSPHKNVSSEASAVGPMDAMLCYAKSLQSCPTLCDPIDGSPPGSVVPGILQARILEWVAISFSSE